MTTPNERLVRMRKSFAKDRSVLTEDYKYFTTPNKAAKQLAKQPAQKHTKCRALVRPVLGKACREQPAKGANHGTQHHLQKQQQGSRSEIPGIHRLSPST